jgi:hypothetical protein
MIRATKKGSVSSITSPGLNCWGIAHFTFDNSEAHPGLVLEKSFEKIV